MLKVVERSDLNAIRLEEETTEDDETIKQGATKMTQEALRQFVEDLFLSRYLERNK